MQGGLLFINHEADLRLIHLNVPVDIHHTGRLLVNVDDSVCQKDTVLFVRTIDLCDKRLQDGRTGRNLRHGDTTLVF